MTILKCQKRHHEPHYVTVPDVGFGVWGDRRCNGRAVWPYARPKPPRIRSHASIGYQIEHPSVLVVYRFGGRWYIDATDGSQVIDYAPSPTHAEAIRYAQNLVNERRKRESATGA